MLTSNNICGKGDNQVPANVNDLASMFTKFMKDISELNVLAGLMNKIQEKGDLPIYQPFHL